LAEKDWGSRPGGRPRVGAGVGPTLLGPRFSAPRSSALAKQGSEKGIRRGGGVRGGGRPKMQYNWGPI